METNTDKLIKKIDKYGKKHLSVKRYEHSVRVAEMAEEICNMFGMDGRIGYLCGIAHDISKEVPKDKMLKMVQKAGYDVTEYELKNMTLLHGKAGKVRLVKKFHVQNEDVLKAVEEHVCGSVNMGEYGKVLYVADKSERGRPHATPEYLEKLFSLSLNDMLKSVVTDTMNHLSKKGYTIYPETKELYESLK